MNFLFNDSSRTNKIFYYSLSACAENQVRDVGNCLRRVLPVLPILANSCLLLASCNRLQVCNHNYYYYFFYVSFPLKDRDFEANETYIFQNMWSTSFDVLFHCICLGCYLVFSYLSFVELLNAQRSSIIQNLKR